MTQTETATTERQTGLNTPEVFRVAANRDEAPSDIHVDADQTAAGALRRERIRGKQDTQKNDKVLALGLISSAGTKLQNFGTNTVLSSLDDDSRQAVNTLRQVAGYARTTLQMMGTAGLGLFAAEAVMTGADIRGDLRRVMNGNAENGARAAVAEVADEAAEVGARSAGRGLRSVFRAAAKRIPLLGSVAVGFFAFNEVSHHWSSGNRDVAMGAAAVGAAETIGSFLTFGLAGDVFREAARWAVTRIGGEEMEAIQRSDVVYIAQTGSDIVREEFGRAAQGEGLGAPIARMASNFTAPAATLG